MLKQEIPINLQHTKSEIVTKDKLASELGSGLVEVYSTPHMILLMENTSSDMIQPYLEEGYASVGTKVDILHLKASPLGATIIASSKYINTEKGLLTFEVEATCEGKVIGKGIHQRAIINVEKFIDKTYNNKEGAK